MLTLSFRNDLPAISDGAYNLRAICEIVDKEQLMTLGEQLDERVGANIACTVSYKDAYLRNPRELAVVRRYQKDIAASLGLTFSELQANSIINPAVWR